jgi:lipoprotein-anchoring transpeptidase ErfK/SrfK/ribosomal protein L12E/L44/L45/RPP1/RPP2
MKTQKQGSNLVLWLPRKSFVVSRIANSSRRELNQGNMKPILKAALVITTCVLILSGCKRQAPAPPPPVAVSTPPAATEAVPITLPVLDALFANEGFKSELKSKLLLTDEQITALRKISSEEVAKLRQTNAEAQPGSAEVSRQTAIESIRGVIGAEKSDKLLALAREHWTRGGAELEAAASKEPEPEMLKGPNAVPADARIVVNIPAFRMDVFANGALVKSYKVGIGYPQFPLPQGLRKAQVIIFNPTWTPPDEPWVASMRGVAVGQAVAAGSKFNPLGPIKVPIGAPSLIHGGKPLAKIGTFASHGCVGMTNSQVRDFASVLTKASETNLSEETMTAYLSKRTRTQVVKLNKQIPVELRYETIVVEDGKVHIYRDVYDQGTNTEETLRAVLEHNGVSFDDLTTEEKTQLLEAVNVLSRHPKKQATPKPTIPKPANSADPIAAANERKAEAERQKSEAERQKKLRNQKEIVIEVAKLIGKGYPAPVNLDSGTGTQANALAATNKP